MIVKNCYFEGLGTEPTQGHIYCDTDANAVLNCSVHDNEFYDCGSVVTGTMVAAGTNGRVRGNNISCASHAAYGIRLNALAGIASDNMVGGALTYGIMAESTRCIISNNVVSYCGGDGIKPYASDIVTGNVSIYNTVWELG